MVGVASDLRERRKIHPKRVARSMMWRIYRLPLRDTGLTSKRSTLRSLCGDRGCSWFECALVEGLWVLELIQVGQEVSERSASAVGGRSAAV